MSVAVQRHSKCVLCLGRPRLALGPCASPTPFTTLGGAGTLRSLLRFCICLRIIVLTKAPLSWGCISGRQLSLLKYKARVTMGAATVTYDSGLVDHRGWTSPRESHCCHPSRWRMVASKKAIAGAHRRFAYLGEIMGEIRLH